MPRSSRAAAGKAAGAGGAGQVGQRGPEESRGPCPSDRNSTHRAPSRRSGRHRPLAFLAPARRTISTIWLMVVPRTIESSTSRTLFPANTAGIAFSLRRTDTCRGAERQFVGEGGGRGGFRSREREKGATAGPAAPQHPAPPRPAPASEGAVVQPLKARDSQLPLWHLPASKQEAPPRTQAGTPRCINEKQQPPPHKPFVLHDSPSSYSP